jgi:transposase
VGATDTAFVGIDVSKATLEACLLRPDGRAKQNAFANDARGHAALIGWADRLAGGAALHFCLEATGPYSEPPALALAAAGRLVSVANPARVKAHAAASGQGNKTDPADARAVALFARDRRPPAWRPPPRKSGNCRAWCGGATTSARWQPARRAASTPRP